MIPGTRLPTGVRTPSQATKQDRATATAPSQPIRRRVSATLQGHFNLSYIQIIS